MQPMNPYSEFSLPWRGRHLVILFALAATACNSVPATRRDATAVAPVAPTVVAAVDRSEADRRFKQALQLLRERKTPEAQAALLALSRDFPGFSGPLTALGILYAQGKQRTPAIEAFAKATDANPDNAVAFNWLGSLCRESGDYRRAESAYRRALQARPDYAPAYLNLAILYDVSLHDTPQALTSYRDYQRVAALPANHPQNLMVSVWIKELEATTSTRGSSPESAR